MLIFLSKFTILLICAIRTNGFHNYEGYKVYEVIASSKHHFKPLQDLREDDNYDFWADINVVGLPIRIMVPPSTQKEFEYRMNLNNIDFRIILDNVEKISELGKTDRFENDSLQDGKLSFTRYLRYAEVIVYLDRLAYIYSNITKLETIGLSYENRTIKSITISSSPDNAKKPIIFIDAGIHAREWIAPAVALYLIHQLVENSTNYALSADVTWVIIPSINPDGYEYSHTTDRFWRKTRSPGYICFGTDANRNMNFHWSETGASDNECSQTYAGPSALSESETRVLSAYLNSFNRHIALYLTLHSYGPYILFPWGWTSEHPENWEELNRLGNDVNDAIRKVNGTNYIVGTSAQVLYKSSGTTRDWAHGVKNIPLSYTIELPGGGSQGFDLPPERILPTVEETFEGLKIFHKHVYERHYKSIENSKK